MDITETSLKNAMPYDEVEPAQYQKVDSVTPAKIKDVARLSGERVATNQEFAWVKEDIDRYQKQKDEKAVSLNEDKRLTEKKEDEQRGQARKKARGARKTKEMQATEITLEQIDGTAKPAEVAKSTTTAPLITPPDEDAYEKAPPTPDFVLEETVHILGDMLGPNVAGTNGAREAEHAGVDDASRGGTVTQ